MKAPLSFSQVSSCNLAFDLQWISQVQIQFEFIALSAYIYVQVSLLATATKE